MKISKKISILGLSLMLFASLSSGAFAEDIEKPSDVESLSGTAGDGYVDLTWSAATDDTGVTGYDVYYGLNSVDEPGDSYDFSENVGDVLSARISGLENGTTYYFSVIAYDAAENESLAWAPELELTPQAGLGSGDDDTTPPQVTDAEALNREEVTVTFSEAVELPSANPETEFFIENQDNFEPLMVLSAEMDADDATNRNIILLTELQSAGTEYKLTVNIGVTDLAGNAIASGTSDTAIFDGSAELKPSEDTDAPSLLRVDVLDSTHVSLQFDEAIVLGIAPEENFEIVQEDDATKKLEIYSVQLGTSDAGIANAAVILSMSEQTGATYLLRAIDVEDMFGNVVSPAVANMTFVGAGSVDDDDDDVADDDDDDDVADDDDDDVAPADWLANLIAKKVVSDGKYNVTLSWKILAEVKDLIVSQKIYMDKGFGFSLKDTLGADVSSYTVSGLEPGNYWFKVSSVDSAGNETDEEMIEVKLAEVGPGVFGLLLVSLGLGGIVTRKWGNSKV